MKLLIFAALIAAAFAFPAEEHRSKRSAVFGAPGVVVSGGTSIIKGPSGVITADTGAIAAPAPAVYAAAPAVVAAPYLGYGVAPAYGHGALVVGPSAFGHGYVKAGGHLFY
ncbi:UNVERIFIED_CONTAM: hypothetical protein PYX00_009522 [Menopon gallinae]|uniref:Uncharacterized protein n=1 Tax=Menopon gallinae TaxID=328185 RepID=A0AAW2HBX7_9NEOP